MFLNVWGVIWPNQKVVIQNAIDTAAGRPANPAAAGAGARAGLASRTNTLLSIPMLFFMGAASHLTLPVPRNGLAFWVVALAILLVVEINALKGTPGQGAAKPLATVKGTHLGGLHPHRRLLRVVRGDALADRNPILHRSPSGPGLPGPDVRRAESARRPHHRSAPRPASGAPYRR